MINHFNFKLFDDCYLITNDLGRSCFLSKEDFELLTQNKIQLDHPLYDKLYEDFFVYDEHPEVFLSRICETMRHSKNYLFHPTSLFIFVVTNICNASCVYCQAQDASSKHQGKMSFETAEKAVDIALSSPGHNLDFEFQGGEPLINFETIKHIIQYSKEKNIDIKKTISYSLVSNLTLLTDEMIAFFKEHKVSISTSLDGDQILHNMNRPMANGSNSFDKVTKQYRKLIDNGIYPGAIETTTRQTFSRYRELIETYVNLKLSSIFIRPLTPLGIAKENWDKIGYEADEYVAFYNKCLRYIIEVNKKGIFLSEGHARLFLFKILRGEGINYMELRSPCGASIGQMAFYYDGRIFTCDEGRMLAEMGNDSFQLGTVSSTYDELIDNPICKATCASSVLESVPSCCDCTYAPYCGTCPVINLALDGDIFAKVPNNYRCKVYSGMLDSVFSLLKENDEETNHILLSWTEFNDLDINEDLNVNHTEEVNNV